MLILLILIINLFFILKKLLDLVIKPYNIWWSFYTFSWWWCWWQCRKSKIKLFHNVHTYFHFTLRYYISGSWISAKLIMWLVTEINKLYPKKKYSEFTSLSYFNQQYQFEFSLFNIHKCDILFQDTFILPDFLDQGDQSFIKVTVFVDIVSINAGKWIICAWITAISLSVVLKFVHELLTVMKCWKYIMVFTLIHQMFLTKFNVCIFEIYY